MSQPIAPLISVVIPTRHRDGTLADCLRRLAPGVQTLSAEQYEVIVTDDGSASTAEAMIQERFPWARWTGGPRRGPAANRNHGASLATGDWLLFTDDDCEPVPGWIAAYARHANEGGRAAEGPICAIGDPAIDLAECPVNPNGGVFWSANAGLARDLFRSVGGFDESYRYAAFEDTALRLALVGAGTDIEFLPDAQIEHPVRVPSLPAKVRRLPGEWDSWAHHVSKHPAACGADRPLTFLRRTFMFYAKGALLHLSRGKPRNAVIATAYAVIGTPYVTGRLLRGRPAEVTA